MLLSHVHHRCAGFTSIEFIIVSLSILALVSISLVYFGQQANRTRTFAAEYHLFKLGDALELYLSDHGTYPADLQILAHIRPPYIPQVFCSTSATTETSNGYQYACRKVEPDSYEISAQPLRGQGFSCWQLSSHTGLKRRDFSAKHNECLGEWTPP
jgi:Tfp pilus assembly protein PilE